MNTAFKLPLHINKKGYTSELLKYSYFIHENCVYLCPKSNQFKMFKYASFIIFRILLNVTRNSALSLIQNVIPSFQRQVGNTISRSAADAGRLEFVKSLRSKSQDLLFLITIQLNRL